MIIAIKGLGNACLAHCKCDTCGAVEEFPAQHEATTKHVAATARAINLVLRDPGRVNDRLNKMGWRIFGRKISCPSCEAARKSHKPEDKPAMAEKIVEIRQPTREEKRQIVEMLTIAYDTTAGRYRGVDTDKTISDAIGNGVMSGWVAEIREAMFGPDGGNDELDNLAADVELWRVEYERRASIVDDAQAKLTTALREFREYRDHSAVFSKRIDVLKKAIGPKAAHA